MQKVILVDEQDNEIGTMEKLQAHMEGQLHRAFSIFLFNDKNEMLLQKRAEDKYHSGGLWTNACCSHPAPNESLEAATKRRLVEELNVHDVDMKKEFFFVYKTEFENGLTEHELDYVFTGVYNDFPEIIPEEASAYRFVSLPDLQKEISQMPKRFTHWFKLALPLLLEHNTALLVLK